MNQHKNIYSNSNTQIKTTSSLLIKSLLWAGLGFVLVCSIAALYSFLFIKFASNIIYTNGYFTGSTILTVVFFIILFITEYKWSSNIIDASSGVVLLNWVLKIFLLAFIIAPLVTLIDQPYFIYMIVGITGVVFAIIAIIGYCFMKLQTAMKINNLIWLLILCMTFFQLIFIFLSSFLWTINFSVYYLVYDLVFMVIIVGSTSVIFYRIKNASQVYHQLSSAQSAKISSYFGLQILTSFIIILIFVARIFLRSQ